MTKKKRKYCWVAKPAEFEIVCPQCETGKLVWSEFEGCIWCYSCKEDIEDYISPMSGPIPMTLAQMLGFNFDRYDLENEVYEHFVDGEWVPHAVYISKQNGIL